MDPGTRPGPVSLVDRIKKSKPFLKTFNEPIWDWSTQKWKGSIIRKTGCNYFDFSTLRPNLIQELRLPLAKALKGDMTEINDIFEGLELDISLECGDLLQIGKSKNRGLFIMSVNNLLPITQLLGGNGFGEIPLNFILDLEKAGLLDQYNPDYWTFRSHPIINHVPYLNSDNSDPLRANQLTNASTNALINALTNVYQNIRINGQVFTITEGSDSLYHPYLYLDFENNEYFTLPAGIKQRFEMEIERIIDNFISPVGNLLQTYIDEDSKVSDAPQETNALSNLVSKATKLRRSKKKLVIKKKDIPISIESLQIPTVIRTEIRTETRTQIRTEIGMQEVLKPKILLNIKPRGDLGPLIKPMITLKPSV